MVGVVAGRVEDGDADEAAGVDCVSLQSAAHSLLPAATSCACASLMLNGGKEERRR